MAVPAKMQIGSFGLPNSVSIEVRPAPTQSREPKEEIVSIAAKWILAAFPVVKLWASSYSGSATTPITLESSNDGIHYHSSILL